LTEISWCIDAWGTAGKKKTKITRDVVDNFLDDCENKMVNYTGALNHESSKPSVIQSMNCKRS